MLNFPAASLSVARALSPLLPKGEYRAMKLRQRDQRRERRCNDDVTRVLVPAYDVTSVFGAVKIG